MVCQEISTTSLQTTKNRVIETNTVSVFTTMVHSRNKLLCKEIVIKQQGIQGNLEWFSKTKEERERKRKDAKEVYYSRLPSHDCISNQFQVSMDRLKNSGWYWERITKTEATTVLQSADVGTFLLRDSSDSRYYFSLSVRLKTNILNIRVLFSHGKFMFDCFETRPCEIPKFDCVVKLICYYVAVSQKQDKRKVLARSEVGEREIKLEKPLFNTVPTLKHLCRRMVNRTLSKEEQSQLLLPNLVESFMRKYPYSI